MKQRSVRVVANAAIGLAALLVILSVESLKVKADDGDRDSRVRIGFQVAPVPLNLRDKDRELVGYGSYLVNVTGDCNGCHTTNPATEYLPTGNPFFGAKSGRVNPATYLAGGQDFGPLIPGSAHIISRNLTPDKTGRPEGGHTFQEFLEIIRRGVDLDYLHPTCSGAPNANCIPAPFDGSLLQVMPWPSYRHASEEDLRAIYEYLSAVPCIAGPPAPSVLHNDCK
jgi:hypothetical protein